MFQWIHKIENRGDHHAAWSSQYMCVGYGGTPSAAAERVGLMILTLDEAYAQNAANDSEKVWFTHDVNE